MPAIQDAVWIDVLPSMKGFAPALARGTAGPSAAAGATSGRAFGKAMLAGVAVVAGGAALAAKALYNIGVTFDDVSDTIRTGTGATGEALADLERSARNVGTRVPASFEDVGKTIADVNTRLGLTGKPLENLSAQFLELSRITGTDVSANVEKVSRVFGDWGVTAKDQSKSLDFLFKVSQSTGIGLDELSTKVVQYGAPMRQFGFSFEDSAALMGKWSKEGVNTETIMGGMRQGLGKLAKSGKEPAKAFKEVTAQIKNAGSSGEATAIAIETFGQRAGPDMAAAVREGRFELDDLIGTLGASGETIMQAGDDTKDFSEQWLLLKNRVMVGLEPIAKRVFAALGDGMEFVATTGIPALSRFVDTLRRFGDTLRGVVKWVKDSAGWIGFLTAAVVGLALPYLASVVAINAQVAAFLVQAAVMRGVAAVTRAYAVAQAVLNAALFANPIGIVVFALVALAGVLVLAYKKSDTFRKVVNGAWAGVKKGWIALWDKALKPGFAALVEFVSETIPGAFRTSVAWVKRTWGDMRDNLMAGWSWVRSRVFQPVTKFVTKTIPDAFRGGVNSVKRRWNEFRVDLMVKWVWVRSRVFQPLNIFITRTVPDAFRRGVAFIKSRWENFKNNLRIVWAWVRTRVFQPLNVFITKTIPDAFRRGVNFVKSRWDNFRNLLKSGWDWVVRYVFTPVRNIITVALPGYFNRGVARVRTYWTRFRDNIKAGWDYLKRVVWSPVKTFVTSTLPGYFSAAVSMVGRIWGKITEKVAGPIRTIKGWINSNLIDPLNKVTKIFGLTIPKLATGGVVRVASRRRVPQALAAGGPVRGPGTGTSDSILGVGADGIATARVSNGEFVVNERATRKHLGLLTAINAGMRPAAASSRGGMEVPGYFLGGLIDKAMTKVTSWIAKGAKFATDSILGPAKTLIGRAVPDPKFANRVATGSVDKLKSLIGAWVDRKEQAQQAAAATSGGYAAGYRPGAYKGQSGMGWQWQMRTLRSVFPGLSLNSGYRPGAITALGNRSMHGLGRAVDVPPMMSVFNWIKRNFPSTKQLFFSPAGGQQVLNGRNWYSDPVTRSGHWDHVHWGYDQGGKVPPGARMVENATRTPEALLNGQQWSDISTLARRGSSQAPGPVFGDLVAVDPRAIATEVLTLIRRAESLRVGVS